VIGRRFKIETRVIVTTNTDLKHAIAAEKFREEPLYFSPRGGIITLPPLGEQGEVLSLPAWEFLQRFAIRAASQI
jgi:transcriptional regulator with GAF, ATPase, and Fis domain